jgi:hypothetical protein
VHWVLGFLKFQILSPIIKPGVRLFVGLVAIPLFRLVVRKVKAESRLSEELTKDLEQWFRGSLLLLLATQNVETFLFREWLALRTPSISAQSVAHELKAAANSAEKAAESAGGKGSPAPTPRGILDADVDIEHDVTLEDARQGRKLKWLSLAMRLLLAIGVIEAMPDQALFSIIHPGPSKLLFPKGEFFSALRRQIGPFIVGLLCRHLDRSSYVFAIMAVILGGPLGWIFYFVAIIQFLIIGLVSSRDKAIDALQQFDAAMRLRRAEIAELQKVGVAPPDRPPDN